MDTKHDERAKAAQQRKQAADSKRDVAPPTTPETGMVQRIPPLPKAYLYRDAEGRVQTGITKADE